LILILKIKYYSSLIFTNWKKNQWFIPTKVGTFVMLILPMLGYLVIFWETIYNLNFDTSKCGFEFGYLKFKIYSLVLVLTFFSNTNLEPNSMYSLHTPQDQKFHRNEVYKKLKLKIMKILNFTWCSNWKLWRHWVLQHIKINHLTRKFPILLEFLKNINMLTLRTWPTLTFNHNNRRNVPSAWREV
jgi:hypothetical protein